MRGVLLEILLISILLNLCQANDSNNCTQNQTYDPQTHTCILQCQPYCSNCQDQYTCLSCREGYYFNDNFDCMLCKAENCKICSSNICSTCMNGYSLNDGGACTKIDNYRILTYAIGGICVFLLMIFSGICYCVGKCQRRRNTINLVHSYPNSNQRINEEPASMVEIKIDDLWGHSDEQGDSIKNQMCSFCLDNLVNTRLSCTHLYHVQCIMKWMRIHHQCPLCKKNVQGNIKIYCSKCFQSSLQINSSFLILQSLPKSSMCQKCESQKKQVEI